MSERINNPPVPKRDPEESERTAEASAAERPILADFIGQPKSVFSWRGAGKRNSPSLFVQKKSYSEEEVQKASATLAARKQGHAAENLGRTPDERHDLAVKKELADDVEKMLTEQAQSIFGPRSEAYVTSEYTDVCQGVDAIVVVRDPQGKVRQIFSVDFTYAETEEELKKKLANGIRGVANGKLSNPQFLLIGKTGKNDTEKIRLNAQMLPKLLIPLAEDTAGTLAQMWKERRNLALEHSPERRALVTLMRDQLKLHRTLSERGTDSFEPYDARISSPKPTTLRNQQKDMQTSLDAGIAYLEEVLADPELENISADYDLAMARTRDLLHDEAAMTALFEIERQKIFEKRAEKAVSAAVHDLPGPQHAVLTSPAALNNTSPSKLPQVPQQTPSMAEETEGIHIETPREPRSSVGPEPTPAAPPPDETKNAEPLVPARSIAHAHTTPIGISSPVESPRPLLKHKPSRYWNIFGYVFASPFFALWGAGWLQYKIFQFGMWATSPLQPHLDKLFGVQGKKGGGGHEKKKEDHKKDAHDHGHGGHHH